MVESSTDSQLVLDYQPCTGPNGSGVLLAPLPLSVPGETYGPPIIHQQATSDELCDDLDDWPTNDAGQGWGLPVFPCFPTLEANKADPPGLYNPVLLDVLPECADGLHDGTNCPYVDAYISAPTELSYKAAMDPSNPERDQWLVAMKDEMESLRAHGTWVFTSVPSRQSVLSGRWLFVKKMGATGLVERYKARFVVKFYATAWD